MKLRSIFVLACAALPLTGCKCGGDKQPSDAAAPVASSAPAPSASVAPARPRRATHPAPKPQELTFTTSDGFKIVGSYWSGGDPKAPAVLLVHRAAGSRIEWTPLIERLFPPKFATNVLAIDLRGHGASVEAKGKKLEWMSFKPADYAAMTRDVEAAIAELDKRGTPSAWVLVGSDLGATLVTRAAKPLGESLRGVALLSPGGSLHGLDLYEPFGKVLRLPNLIVTSAGDGVSAEPAAALSQMSKGSRLLRLSGAMHGAEYMGAEHPLMWDELADWVEERLATPSAGASVSAAPSAAPADSVPAR